MTWRHALSAQPDETSVFTRRANEYPRFAPISSEAFQQFSGLPDCYQVAPNTRLVEQGTTPKHVLLVFQGLLRLDHLSLDGSEIMLGLRSNGWYANSAPVLMGIPSEYSVTTVSDCTLSAVPAKDFLPTLMQNARLLRHFIATLCGELTSQGGVRAQLLSGTAEDRLTCFLSEREVKDERWSTFDPLPFLKQMELAQLLAITPETLSRIIHKRVRTKKQEASRPDRVGPSLGRLSLSGAI